jgi:outer membrane biosynthesis protein TonB
MHVPFTPRSRHRRIVWPLAGSLVVHALVCIALMLHRPEPRPAVDAARPPVVVEFLQSEPPPKEVDTPANPEPPAAPPRRLPPQPRAQAVGPSADEADPASPSPAADGAAERVAEAPRGPGPRLRTLLPSAGLMDGWAVADAAPERSGGRTLTNGGPPSEADQARERNAQARAGERRVDGWARDEVASQRVRVAAVDHYFSQLGRALERAAQVERPPELDVAQGARRALNAYRANLEHYGATGAPVTPGGAPPGQRMPPDPNGRHEVVAALAEQHARNQELMRRFGAGELIVIVELAQDAQGRVTELVVVRGSGDAAFDARVAQLASLMEPVEGIPDHVAARSPNGIRTTWEFRGRYEFRKKLRDLNVDNPADAAYLAAAGVGSLLAGGGFDEVSGDIYVIDLRDPKFQVRATLLRLY